MQWTVNNVAVQQQTESNSDSDTINKVLRERAAARFAGNWTCVVDYGGKVGRASATLTMKGENLNKEDVQSVKTRH